MDCCGKAPESMTESPPIVPGSPEVGRTLSILIPARNEEHNLPRLLDSIARQSVKAHEILVVDDGSTDRTASLAREYGARVIALQPLPEGWRGKTWACHQGAGLATGELLMFVDADTWFEPEGLSRVLSAYPGGAFSVGPHHAVRKVHEELSMFFNFAMTAGTVPGGLFGQLLLVDRESYRRTGGHEAVQGCVLENVRLAGLFRAAGVPVRGVAGRGVLSFRMYPGGVRELIEGWTKGFASGAGRTPGGALFLIVAWMIGLMLAFLGGLASGGGLAWVVAYLLCAAQVGWFSRMTGSFRWSSAFLFPIPLVFFFVVFGRSAFLSGKRVTWKGREFRAD